MQKTTAKNIFISYRLQDTAGETGRLVDSLSNYFAEDQIFRDIDKLEPGTDFVDEIGKKLASCDVMLAVIGPNWMGIREGKPPRIHDPNDWVRLELGTALQRNIRVVPVLVDGGQLPSFEELPVELQPLLRRQTHEITNKRWKYDADQLIKFLIHSMGITPKPMAAPSVGKAPPTRRTSPWTFILVGLSIIAILFFIFRNLPNNESKADDRKEVLNAYNENKTADPERNATALNNNNTYSQLLTGTWKTSSVISGDEAISLLYKSKDDIPLNLEVTIMVEDFLTYRGNGIFEQVGYMNILLKVPDNAIRELRIKFSLSGRWEITGNELNEIYTGGTIAPDNELAREAFANQPLRLSDFNISIGVMEKSDILDLDERTLTVKSRKSNLKTTWIRSNP